MVQNTFTSVIQCIENCLQCSICLSLLSGPVRTGCLHVFCKQCLDTHLQGSLNSQKGTAAACPLCYKRLNLGSILIDKKIEKIVVNFQQCKQLLLDKVQSRQLMNASQQSPITEDPIPKLNDKSERSASLKQKTRVPRTLKRSNTTDLSLFSVKRPQKATGVQRPSTSYTRQQNDTLISKKARTCSMMPLANDSDLPQLKKTKELPRAVVVCFSGFDPDVGLPKFINSEKFAQYGMNLKFTYNIEQPTTHLVVEGNVTRNPPETFKTILASIRRVAIIELRWLIDSYYAQRWLREDQYLIKSPVKYQKFQLDRLETYISRCCLVPYGALNSLTYKNIKQISQQLSIDIVNIKSLQSVNVVDKVANILIIVGLETSDHQMSKLSKFLQKLHNANVQVVSAQWLIDSLLSANIVPTHKYML
ncbi:hypothetical protein MIR68_006825 [Amoeboaphelidium protococcarum]|nr:hypothetical protein MIR68_006825 [Amoeboaphelidium protococcarum]